MHPGDALWLILATPQWYFRSILSPFSAGVFSAIPALGIVCLLAGAALGFRYRQKRLLMCGVPFILSVSFGGVAGLLRGEVPNGWADFIMYGFLAGQLILSVWLVYFARRAWPAAALLAVFSMSYALFAAFIAYMSFTDTWL
ncbi:MAG: hypothetical protein AB7O49_18555 [Sphingomonadales bacterium]